VDVVGLTGGDSLVMCVSVFFSLVWNSSPPNFNTINTRTEIYTHLGHRSSIQTCAGPSNYVQFDMHTCFAETPKRQSTFSHFDVQSAVFPLFGMEKNLIKIGLYR